MGKKAQVWVETVVYTLIGLVLIGTVLAIATPFINEQKDRAIIERTSEAMNSLDNTILNIKSQGIGNKREFSFLIGKGSLLVDPKKDEIKFIIEESNYKFSEPGFTIDISGTNMKVRTVKSGKKYDVTLILNYLNNVDISYDFVVDDNDVIIKEGNSEKRFSAAPSPYKLIIENLGKVPMQVSSCTGATTDGNPCTTVNANDGKCSGTLCVPINTKINIKDAS